MAKEIDTSVKILNPFLQFIARIPEAISNEIKESIKKLNQSTPLEIKVDGEKIMLFVGTRDLGQGKEIYYGMARKKGYTTYYSSLTDILRFENLGEKFVDKLVKNLRYLTC